MKDTKLNNWQEFIIYQNQRGISGELIQLLKDIYAHLKIQYSITPEQVNLRYEKMTFQVANNKRQGKLFLNVLIKKSFLRLLLLNDGVIPAIATKVEGVKGYPNLHKIELSKNSDFTTEVRMAILKAYKVVSEISIFNNKTTIKIAKE
ncbi:MAG: hypothetical protein AB8G86_20680, partial [Saprospiraceae bacterium]